MEILGANELGPLDHGVNNVYPSRRVGGSGPLLADKCVFARTPFQPSDGRALNDLDRRFGIWHVVSLSWIFFFQVFIYFTYLFRPGFHFLSFCSRFVMFINRHFNF